MTGPIHVVHVVRDYGGVTEPFIEQRLRATPDATLCCERLRAQAPAMVTVDRVGARGFTPGSPGDRLLHRVPQLSIGLEGAYRAAEARLHPDVIHAHYLSTGSIVGRATRSPLVVSAYGFDVSLLPRRRLWRRRIRELASRARFVLAEGPHMADAIEGLGFHRAQIRLLPIAAALQGIAFRPPRLGADDLRLLCCGRLVEKKGHGLAIAALAAVAVRLPGARLTIVGDGPLRGHLTEQADALGIRDRVDFRGALGRAEYLSELAGSDVLLAPSLVARNGDTEGGAPTTILDAQATGVLVVGSTHADIPYLVEDGVTGLLVGEDDVDALANGIVRAVGARASWSAITIAGRHQVEVRHADDVVAAALARTYAETTTA